MNDRRPTFQDAAIYILLRKARKNLKPAELTELRLALRERYHGELRDRFERLLDESWLEREEKRETPKKHG